MSEEMSKSKKKRLAIQEERAKARKKKAFTTFLAIAIPLLLLGVVVAIVLHQRKVAEENRIDYGKYFADNGTIANISIDDYITFNYKDMSFSKKDLLPDDSVIENDINNLVTEHRYIPENDTAVSKDGDNVNICYESSIDGVSYNQITEAGGGLDIKIGDETMTAGFDKALIGHKKGDKFTTEVSYDAEYGVPELAGKTVKYDITFNGIYVTPEFNDEFVKENLAGEASTAEEYKVSLVNSYYESNLSTAISESLSANYVINKLPEEFVANDEKVLHAMEEQKLQYYNQMYAAYGMEPMGSLAAMYGFTTEEEVNNMIHENAVRETEEILAYQYVFVHEGMTNTPDEVKAYFMERGETEEQYNEYLAQYGFNYLASAAMQGKVQKFLVENVNVTP